MKEPLVRPSPGPRAEELAGLAKLKSYGLGWGWGWGLGHVCVFRIVFASRHREHNAIPTIKSRTEALEAACA